MNRPARGEAVEVNGARLWVESVGEGLPVVFVHAGVCDRRMWAPQVAALRGMARVITYDHRGYGRSDRASAPFSYAGDLLGVLDALGTGEPDRTARSSAAFEQATLFASGDGGGRVGAPRRPGADDNGASDAEKRRDGPGARARTGEVVLVGASMGGAAALDVALDHPGRVRALVLVGTAMSGSPFSDAETLGRYERVVAAMQAGDAAGAVEAELDLWYAGVGRALGAVDPEVLALGREMLAACHRSPVDEALELAPERPAAGRLAELRVPTEAIIGAHDLPDLQRVTRRLGEVGARVHVVEGAAHFPNLERAEAVTAVVRGVIRGG